jgi:hypothetical protein
MWWIVAAAAQTPDPPPLAAEFAPEVAAPAEDAPGETVVVEAITPAEARAAIAAALADEGYRRSRRKGDALVLLSDQTWKPRVWIGDEGEIRLLHQPTRFHPPGRAFADQAAGVEWAMCVIQPWACLHAGTRTQAVTDRRVVVNTRERISAAIGEPSRVYRDAIAAEATRQRIEFDLPREFAAIWAGTGVAVDRRQALFELWDSRADTPEGQAARAVILAFIRGEVMTSADPYPPEELSRLNAGRRGGWEFAP